MIEEKYLTKNSMSTFDIDSSQEVAHIQSALDKIDVPYYSVYDKENWQISVNYSNKEIIKKIINEYRTSSSYLGSSKPYKM